MRSLLAVLLVTITGCGGATPAADAGPDTPLFDAPPDRDAPRDAAPDAPPDPPPDAGTDAPEGTDAPMPAGLDGDACESSADCLAGSECNLENTFGAPGYCVSPCADRPLLSGDAPIEQGSCTDGSVCVPFGGSSSGCVRRCDVDADCARTAGGYFCRHDFGAFHSDVGVCAPPHCRSRGGCEHAGCGC